MEGAEEQDAYEQSFVDKPDILDKYKAAGVICDGKLKTSSIYYIFKIIQFCQYYFKKYSIWYYWSVLIVLIHSNNLLLCST